MVAARFQYDESGFRRPIHWRSTHHFQPRTHDGSRTLISGALRIVCGGSPGVPSSPDDAPYKLTFLAQHRTARRQQARSRSRSVDFDSRASRSRECSDRPLSNRCRDGVSGGGCEGNGFFVKFGRFMKRLDATWGAQRNHEPARSGGCQTTATRFMGSPAAISGAPRGYETTKKRNAGFIDSPAARDGCATALIGSGTKSNERGAFPLEKNLADDNDTDSYHQAVRAWKALVEIADNKGVAPFVAGWAKARINLLDPGAAIRPAPSARPETERMAAWWSKSVAALNQKLGKRDFPVTQG